MADTLTHTCAKGKFSKQMKKKLSYRPGPSHSQTYIKVLRTFIWFWVNWSRLCINKLRKNAFNPIIRLMWKGLLWHPFISTHLLWQKITQLQDKIKYTHTVWTVSKPNREIVKTEANRHTSFMAPSFHSNVNLHQP